MFTEAESGVGHLFANLWDADEGGVRVLHLDAPALHGAEPVAESRSRLRLIVLLGLGLVQERTHRAGCGFRLGRRSGEPQG